MKTLYKTILLLFLLALVPISLVGQSSKIVKEKRNLSGFSAINLSGGWDAVLTQGENFSVAIEANKEYLNDLRVEVKNETLYVYNERRSQHINTTKHSEIRKVHITFDELQGITALMIGDVRRKKNRHEIERTLHLNNKVKYEDNIHFDTEESSGFMNQFLGLVNRFLDVVNQFVGFICHNAGFETAL